jgi:pimeloyl-ACP methyl ester carboxylesterase
LAGCSGVHLFSSSKETAQDFAATQGFEKRVYRAGNFEITSFARKFSLSNELTVYIEGDGAPWYANNIPPSDPTPRRLIVLELAAKDKRSALLYLARPCQFLEEQELQRCSPEYWMDRRYSEEVVAAIDKVINQAMQERGATRLNLVGYSGGGTIALYLTERRHDVTKLITVASPLDHRIWTQYHGLSPLTGSLGPVAAWQKLNEIPQYHLVGDKDPIVPPILLRSMLPPNARILVIHGFDHECCWIRDWEKLLAETGSLHTE